MHIEAGSGAVPAGPGAGIGEVRSFSREMAGTPLLDCFRFWCVQCSGGRPPLKRRIDPVTMPRHILPHLFMYEYVDGRFRCRLAGTRIADVFKEDPTGRYLDDLLSAAAAESRTRLFRGVVERGMPVIYGGKLAAGPKQWMSFKRLLLPVSKTGAEIDIVFGMVVFPQFDRRADRRYSPKDQESEFEAWAVPEELAGV